MKTMSRDLIPAPDPDYAVPPGETLRDRLSEIDMTQADLARRTGLTAKHINQVVRGSASISAEVAQRLSYVTGVPASWWLRLEADYRAALARLEQDEALQDSAAWVDTMPVQALVSVGALPREPKDRLSRFKQLLEFFGVASVDAFENIWRVPAAAFRQSSAYQVEAGAVAAWLRLGELAALERDLPSFDEEGLRARVPEVRSLTRRPINEGVSRLVSLTAESGLALIFVPDIPGTRAYGATRWLGGSRRPLIQLSLRGRTDDKLWETVFHELKHVLDHDRRAVFVELEGEDQAARTTPQPSEEAEAEAFARTLIVPSSFEPELADLKTIEDVLDFAERLDVAPSLIVSRLQRDGLWRYDQGRPLKHEVSETAFEQAQGAASQRSTRFGRRSNWSLPGSDRG